MQSTFINTAYNVNVEFPLAGIGKRLLAWIIDVIIRIVYLLIAQVIIASIFNTSSYLNGESDSINIISQLFIYIPLVTYYLWQEILFNGRTIGKMAMNIRVISLDGYKPTPSQIVNRWLFRLVDTCLVIGFFVGVFNSNLPWFAGCFLINVFAIIVVLRSDKQQRIGDVIANTIVVNIVKQLTLNDTLYVEVQDNYVPKYPQVTQLNDRDISIIKDMLRGFYNTTDDAIINRSLIKVTNALQITPTETSSVLFFERLVADYNYYTTRE